MSRIMIWALNENREKVRAGPGGQGICPGCGGAVRAHCGDVRIWHWHHETAECDPWHETETDWHLKWKMRFPEEWREFWKAPHRADVAVRYGVVIEFQHSAIEPRDIQERETFWEDLVWVFDAREWFHNFEVRFKSDKTTFRWKHPRQSLFATTRPVYLDTGEEIFEMLFLGHKVPCGGTGRFIPYKHFLKLVKGNLQHKIDEAFGMGGK